MNSFLLLGAQNFPQNCYYFEKIHFEVGERTRKRRFEFFSVCLFVSSSGLKRKKGKTFVGKLRKETGWESTRTRHLELKESLLSFNHIQLRHYPQLREISNGFSLATVFLVFLFSTQLLKISYSYSNTKRRFSSIAPSFQQRSHYSPSRQFLPPLNDPL